MLDIAKLAIDDDDLEKLAVFDEAEIRRFADQHVRKHDVMTDLSEKVISELADGRFENLKFRWHQLREEKPIVNELNQTGLLYIKRLSDLNDDVIDNAVIVKVLFSHLNLPYVDYTKGQIIRLFGGRMSKLEYVGTKLLDFYENPSTSDNLRSTTSLTLGDAAQKSDLERVKTNILEGSHCSRVGLFSALVRLDRKPAADILVQVIDKPGMSYEAIRALNKCKDPVALPYIEKYLDDPDAETRQLARKVYKKLEHLKPTFQ